MHKTWAITKRYKGTRQIRINKAEAKNRRTICKVLGRF